MHPMMFLGICLFIASAIGFTWRGYAGGHLLKAGVNALVAVVLTAVIAYEVS